MKNVLAYISINTYNRNTMKNKYMEKLCTPEQNKRQIAALTILAVGLTTILILSILGVI
jgi:hypothetical protein